MNSCALEWVFVSPFFKTKLQTSSLEEESDFMKSCMENSFLRGEEIAEQSF